MAAPPEQAAPYLVFLDKSTCQIGVVREAPGGWTLPRQGAGATPQALAQLHFRIRLEEDAAPDDYIDLDVKAALTPGDQEAPAGVSAAGGGTVRLALFAADAAGGGSTEAETAWMSLEDLEEACCCASGALGGLHAGPVPGRQLAEGLRQLVERYSELAIMHQYQQGHKRQHTASAASPQQQKQQKKNECDDDHHDQQQQQQQRAAVQQLGRLLPFGGCGCWRGPTPQQHLSRYFQANALPAPSYRVVARMEGRWGSLAAPFVTATCLLSHLGLQITPAFDSGDADAAQQNAALLALTYLCGGLGVGSRHAWLVPVGYPAWYRPEDLASYPQYAQRQRLRREEEMVRVCVFYITARWCCLGQCSAFRERPRSAAAWLSTAT